MSFWLLRRLLSSSHDHPPKPKHKLIKTISIRIYSFQDFSVTLFVFLISKHFYLSRCNPLGPSSASLHFHPLKLSDRLLLEEFLLVVQTPLAVRHVLQELGHLYKATAIVIDGVEEDLPEEWVKRGQKLFSGFENKNGLFAFFQVLKCFENMFFWQFERFWIVANG